MRNRTGPSGDDETTPLDDHPESVWEASPNTVTTIGEGRHSSALRAALMRTSQIALASIPRRHPAAVNLKTEDSVTDSADDVLKNDRPEIAKSAHATPATSTERHASMSAPAPST